ncbi:hypothetical protein V0288_11730 [Pannus brasiliensis CCIBt3594]|uniref:Uncharacterized protein n=1 Tax=Pannus brasiliensis CCIBt3594 TaxID=1427578 RepID=A0AAW9QY51_9CHRO
MALIDNRSTLSCASCPFFEDYDDERGRGWCREFNRPARRHHRGTRECEQVNDRSLVKVRVEVYTNEVEDDGNGHPVPIDSQLIDLKVPHLTLADVTAALSSAIDLSAWTIASYWEPVPDAEF